MNDCVAAFGDFRLYRTANGYELVCIEYVPVHDSGHSIQFEKTLQTFPPTLDGQAAGITALWHKGAN